MLLSASPILLLNHGPKFGNPISLYDDIQLHVWHQLIAPRGTNFNWWDGINTKNGGGRWGEGEGEPGIMTAPAWPSSGGWGKGWAIAMEWRRPSPSPSRANRHPSWHQTPEDSRKRSSTMYGETEHTRKTEGTGQETPGGGKGPVCRPRVEKGGGKKTRNSGRGRHVTQGADMRIRGWQGRRWMPSRWMELRSGRGGGERVRQRGATTKTGYWWGTVG